MPIELPDDLCRFGKTLMDYEAKRQALVIAGETCSEERISTELYEDLINDCKDYEKLEKLYRGIAHFLDQQEKDSFEYQ